MDVPAMHLEHNSAQLTSRTVRRRKRQQSQQRGQQERARHRPGQEQWHHDLRDQDNSNSSAGSFFEGFMTAGYPTATGTIVAGDNSAKCVDDNNGSGSPGTKVQMWDCDGNTAAQNWTVNSNGTLTIAGGCMDITGAKSANGTLIELWTCNGGANQHWTLPKRTQAGVASSWIMTSPGEPRR
jgi:hypothetical protein